MDIAIFHANSNNFIGPINQNLNQLRYLYELDLSNNKFLGGVPWNVLGATNLTFVDLRFNTTLGIQHWHKRAVHKQQWVQSGRGKRGQVAEEEEREGMFGSEANLGFNQVFFFFILLNLNWVGGFYLFLIRYAM